MFKELNPLLHGELRLAVMSLLISVEEADFCIHPPADRCNVRQSQCATG